MPVSVVFVGRQPKVCLPFVPFSFSSPRGRGALWTDGVNLVMGIDLDALVEKMTKARGASAGEAEGEESPLVHLPI
jgi:hypothetical protein